MLTTFLKLKITPDFIEYFYGKEGEVKPNMHYVPASLDNITEVVAHVMDENNDDKMKAIVKSANSWCKRSLSEEGLAKESILQLEAYKKSLDSYDKKSSWSKDWKHVKERFTNTLDDLVDCNAWSIFDFFTFPM